MKIEKYLKMAIDKKASDIHLVGGAVPSLRCAGKLEFIKEEPLSKGAARELVKEMLNEQQMGRLEQDRDLDVALALDDYRFRINIHFQREMLAIAARLVPNNIPDPSAIGLNDAILQLTKLNAGLVLVTGPSGSGKSTTLASMLELINKERSAHIITIEDPIEFMYTNQRSLIEQREIGRDAPSFAGALKYVLRQDPNIILLGEMRDLETIQSALTAAETGHLVFSTLHTQTAAATVERIIDMFEGARQKQVLLQLAGSLRAVISQQLIPTVKGGLAAAREIMLVNPAVANLIRENKVAQIASVIQTSAKEGMITMEAAVEKLHNEGIIGDTDVKRGKERGKTF